MIVKSDVAILAGKNTTIVAVCLFLSHCLRIFATHVVMFVSAPISRGTRECRDLIEPRRSSADTCGFFRRRVSLTLTRKKNQVRKKRMLFVSAAGATRCLFQCCRCLSAFVAAYLSYFFVRSCFSSAPARVGGSCAISRFVGPMFRTSAFCGAFFSLSVLVQPLTSFFLLYACCFGYGVLPPPSVFCTRRVRL